MSKELSSEIEWFYWQSVDRDALAISFSDKSVCISKNLTNQLEEKGATHIQLGISANKIIVKPSDNGLKLIKHQKQAVLSLTKALAGWLKQKKIKGKYEFVYNENHKWYESNNIISDNEKE